MSASPYWGATDKDRRRCGTSALTSHYPEQLDKLAVIRTEPTSGMKHIWLVCAYSNEYHEVCSAWSTQALASAEATRLLAKEDPLRHHYDVETLPIDFPYNP